MFLIDQAVKNCAHVFDITEGMQWLTNVFKRFKNLSFVNILRVRVLHETS